MGRASQRPGERRWPALLASATIALAVRANANTAATVTLTEAVTTGLTRSPRLAARTAAVAATTGRLRQARLLPFNPTLGFGAGNRDTAGDGSSTDSGLVLAQELEIGGQRGHRIGAASSELSAAEALLERERQAVVADITNAFAAAVGARQLLEIQRLDAALAGDFATLTGKRFAAGAASQIERNLAEASFGRAERQQELATANYRAAQARLAEAMGADPAQPVEPQGEPPRLGSDSSPLEERIGIALVQRADLRALERRAEAAEAQRRLSRAERIPNLTVAGSYEEEGRSDDILGASVTVGLPLFNRNQGTIAAASADIAQARAELSTARLGIEREVTTADARLRAAEASVRGLEKRVVGRLSENLELLQRAFDAGKVGSAELLLFRQEFVQARREHVEAVTDAWQARNELDLALGQVAVPSPTGEDRK